MQILWTGSSATVASPDLHAKTVFGLNHRNNVKVIEPDKDNLLTVGLVHHVFIRPSGRLSLLGTLVNSTSILIHNRRNELFIRDKTDYSKTIGFADSTASLTDIMSFMQQSLFWTKANEETRKAFLKGITTELRKLRVFGFLEKRGDVFQITTSGKTAARVMFWPFSMKNLIDNAKRVIEGSFDEKSQTILLLSLVGIPWEISSNDDIVERVKVSEECEFVSTVIGQDQSLYEPVERMQLCPQYATVLNYWINSVPTEQILKQSNLDPTADAALFEELLPNDAYWVLETLARIPDSTIPMSKKQREFLLQLATWCKLGSSDELVIRLLKLNLKHMGRGTAIKLAAHLQKKNKKVEQLSEEDLFQLFPENQESAKNLMEELRERGIIGNN